MAGAALRQAACSGARRLGALARRSGWLGAWLVCAAGSVSMAQTPGPVPIVARARQAPLPPGNDSTEELPRRQFGLVMPKGLPGADAPSIQLPPYDPTRPQERLDAIAKLFPPLPRLPPPIYESLSPDQQPFTLAGLESMAVGLSPTIRQATSSITAARGNAIQMGTPPNPTVGYEADTVGSSRNPDYHGVYFNQWIKTAGKLQLQQSAAAVDIRNAELDLRKARIELINKVQAAYYAVLVAEEGVRIYEKLVEFADEAYRIHVLQLRGGEAAPYETHQLRVIALQARSSLVLARNRYFSAWAQLAAAVNMPNMPPTKLAGNPKLAVPALRYDILRNIMWEQHTDIMRARNSEQQARILLRFEEITPIPDVYLYGTLQKDYTVGSPGASFNLQLGVPVPIFDRNVGGILNAQGNLHKASQEALRVRNELTGTLADAFERYENNRAVLNYFDVFMLRDQARAYHGAFDRHQLQPDRVGFADVVVAMQTYVAVVSSYITALGNQWIAVTDLLATVQAEDLLDVQRAMDTGALIAPQTGPALPPGAGAEPIPAAPLQPAAGPQQP